MKRTVPFLAAMLWAAGLLAAEAPAAPTADIADADIAELAARARESLDKRVSDIEKTHAERQAFSLQLKVERVAFERKSSAGLLVFLESLKAVPAPDRRATLLSFSRNQRMEREIFVRDLQAKIDDFRRRHLE